MIEKKRNAHDHTTALRSNESLLGDKKFQRPSLNLSDFVAGVHT
jgi:hypothetical protein